MWKCKSSHSLGSLYRSIICLTLGFLIGIQLTSFWYNFENEAGTGSGSGTETEAESPLHDLAQYLFNSTRVLCFIATSPPNHLHKAVHIRHTWGKRCNKVLFMSTEEDEELQTVKLDVEEGRHNLWNKTKMALKYIYDHHYEEAEWFLKADDDTYVIMENLRYLLYAYSSETPIYFGAKLRPFVRQVQGYMSGGAGYVLSKESLRKFVLEAYENPQNCPEIFKSEDVQLGYCFQSIGVVAGDARDEWGLERFMPLAIEHLIPNNTSLWYKNYTYYPHKENETCCSSSAISFHYIEPYQFYVLDYLLYTLSPPFGVLRNIKYSLPKKLNSADGNDASRFLSSKV